MKVKDLFSANAREYSVFRPDYPTELFDFIFCQIKISTNAWDCGTGNGQAAKVLAQKFDSVYATDISEKQMANGYPAKNISYSVCPAEHTSFPNSHFDLITVAQAAHWFRLEDFYKEVNRVVKPNGVVALWGYGLLSINPQFDARLQHFYKSVIGPYWDFERKLIDDRYRTIPFPFDEITAPEFHFTKQWNLIQLEGYLSTWSAVQKFIQTNGQNPVEDFLKSNQSLFDDGPQEVSFPLFLRIGFVNQ